MAKQKRKLTKKQQEAKHEYNRKYWQNRKNGPTKNVESLQDAMSNAKSDDTIFVNPPNNPVQATEEPRASNKSYVFVGGNKVLIRNLTDELLNERYEQVMVSEYEARRVLQQLEDQDFNLSLEQKYRGLK